MRRLAAALLGVALCAAAHAEDATSASTSASNPTHASNPAGAPPVPPKWEMAEDQKAHRGECMKLTKQIARYERDANWAKERDNEMWELASREKVYRLAAKREDLCPSPKGPTSAELLAKAADLALKLAVLAAKYGAL